MVIQAINLGKKYKRYPNQWSRFAEWLLGERYHNHEEKWVLRGVTFKLESGEALGIVGQNGAGKSTLLKIIAGTTAPNEGKVVTSGKISALLELGIGLHPDFTGRENATMICRMAGMPPDEINSLLPEIEGFSELKDYFDQPMRVYSTGMEMRLAFSSSTAERPDLLIIDEAFAVGDAYFSHKCINRIRDFKKKGTSLLFVSHAPGAIKTICDRALLIDGGMIIKDGDPDVVLDYYNAMIAKQNKDYEIRQVENKLGRTVTRSGNKKAYIDDLDLFDMKGRSARAFQVGDKVLIRCQVKFREAMENPTVGILIRDRLGCDIFGTNTFYLGKDEENFQDGEQIDVCFTLDLNLGYGSYSLCVAVHSGADHLRENYDWWDQCLSFQVIPNNSFYFLGVAALPLKVEIRKVESNKEMCEFGDS